ncbi:hypothetical protein OJF2_01890 [Aquisphaera giovannonii]|uniref:Uncharacterized protein n=1 Tax=Aquisphaera giovannonii TaxID=406548 RepID=A0A5B9VUG2_9BACT|nr:hypothetical protein [Aquisphaera giovannonii]QEH31724.1 hypothetical protein OJF2_01890 [Aquisphaera giovannonii]
MEYFCSVVRKGVMRLADVPGAMGVSQTPAPGETIGTALARGQDLMGRAVFNLIVGESLVPGRWNLADGVFVAAES